MNTVSVNKPRWLSVVTVLLGTVTVSLNNSALNPAVPEFMRVFDISPTTASWIITAFLISMGMTMPITGFLSQRFGKRRIYLIGLSLFVCGSTAGALAVNMPWIIAARALQGMAGGLMIPLSLPLLFDLYPKSERGRMTGIWGTAVMLAPAVGPVVGGVLLHFASWPLLFVMNIPTGIIGLVVGAYCLPKESERTLQPFDLKGFLLVTTGVGVLLVALSRMTEVTALVHPFNLSLIAGAVLCLVLFVRHELQHDSPLLNLRIFAIRHYSISIAIVVAQSVSMFSSMVMLPLLMQPVLGYSPMWTGVALLATAVCASAFVNIGGNALDRNGARGIVSFGLLCSASASLAFGFVTEYATQWLIIMLMMIRGIGVGLSYMPATTAGLNTIPEHLVAQGSAMNNILRRITSSMAVVLVSLYFEVRSAALTAAGETALHSQVSAIQEIFLSTGVLLLAVIPLALCFPKPNPVVEAVPVEPRRNPSLFKSSPSGRGFR